VEAQMLREQMINFLLFGLLYDRRIQVANA
jgi:hypothetical protein